MQAPPPLEALKILIADVTNSNNKDIAIHDISKAFFYVKVVRPVFVKIPNEAEEKGKDVEKKMSLIDSYAGQFSANIVEAEAAESETSMARMGLIALSFGSSFGLFAVLLLPAILRIERKLD